MATQTTKRVAQIFIEAKDAEKVLERLAAEAKHWANELDRVPQGSKAAIAATKNLTQIQSQYAKVANGIKASNAEIKQSEGVWGGLKKSLGPIGPAIAGAFAIGSILSFGRTLKNAAQESEAATARAETAFQNAGDKIGLSFDQITAAASQLEENSLFTDEDILNKATTTFLNFGNITGQTLLDAQRVATDVATSMEGDLQGAATAVGKALNSPTEGLAALQRMGVRFSDDQKKTIQSLMDTGHAAEAQSLILAELEKRFGGQAAAQAEAEGGYHRLKVATDALAESTGGALNEALKDMSGWLGDAIATGAEWLGFTNKQSDAVIGQKAELNALFSVLKSGNKTEEERAALVQQINEGYKDYLPTLLSVNSTEEEFAAAQRIANRVMNERIELLAKQELMEEAQKEAVENRKDQIKAEIKYQEVANGKVSLWDQIKASASGAGSAERYYAGQLGITTSAAINAQAEFTELEKKYGSVSEAQKKAAAATADVTTVGGRERATLEQLQKSLASNIALRNEFSNTVPTAVAAQDQLIASIEAEIQKRNELAGEEAQAPQSINAISEALKKKQDLYANATSDEARAGLRAEMDALEQQKAALEGNTMGWQQRVDAVKQMNEAIRKAAREQELERLDGEAKEVEQSKEKYNELRKQAAGNSAALAQIAELEGNALQGIREKYAEKEAERMQQLSLQLRAIRAQGDGDDETQRIGAAMQATQERYAAEIAAAEGQAERIVQLQSERDGQLSALQDELSTARQAKQAERDQLELDQIAAKYEKEIEAAAGQADVLAQLEVNKAAELDAKRQEQAEARAAKEQEWADVLDEERAARAAKDFELMEERHALELEQAEEGGWDMAELTARQYEEKQALLAEQRALEFEELDAHYEELYARADALGVNTTELQRLHGEAVAQLKREQASTEIAATEEKNRKIVESEKKRNAAIKQVGMEMVDAVGALFQATAANAEEAADYQKILTLFKVGVDTASAISSIIAASALGDPFTAALRMATGIALVLTNIAKATALLKDDAPQAPTFQATGTAAAKGGYLGQGKGQRTGRRQRIDPEGISWFDNELGTKVTLTQPPVFDQNFQQGGWRNRPTYAVVGEKGREWVGSSWMVNHPTLAPMFNYLEDVRSSGRVPHHGYAYANGGFVGGAGTGTSFTGGSGLASQGGGEITVPAITATTDPALLSLIAAQNIVLQELNAQLDAGIGVNYNALKSAERRIGTINTTNQLAR